MDTGLLALRVAVGVLLAGHGVQKLFGWCSGGGLAATTWFFRSVGYRPPRLMAGLCGGVELVGGVALASGLGIHWRRRPSSGSPGPARRPSTPGSIRAT
jgi:putative oxidoreductase